jgi:hypothetical protein
MDQNEEVLTKITFIEFVIDNTGYAFFINNRLLYVRCNVKCECNFKALLSFYKNMLSYSSNHLRPAC